MSAGTSRGMLLRYLAFTFTPIAGFGVCASLWPWMFWWLFGITFVCVFFLFHWTESMFRDWRTIYNWGMVAADQTAKMGFPPYTGPGCIIIKMKRGSFPRLMYIIIMHHNSSCMYQGWNLWNTKKIPEDKKIMKRSVKHWQVA